MSFYQKSSPVLQKEKSVPYVLLYKKTPVPPVLLSKKTSDPFVLLYKIPATGNFHNRIEHRAANFAPR